ncbi:hypothetical protein niasHT_027938 [Heterodera trifolii]|uniref:Ubiquitin-like protease family profile domain-containing protein n=1 Tax=Heterodera trifolii TaxID=157864 RepID=A0ABD2JX29_9BILA
MGWVACRRNLLRVFPRGGSPVKELTGGSLGRRNLLRVFTREASEQKRIKKTSKLKCQEIKVFYNASWAIVDVDPTKPYRIIYLKQLSPEVFKVAIFFGMQCCVFNSGGRRTATFNEHAKVYADQQNLDYVIAECVNHINEAASQFTAHWAGELQLQALFNVIISMFLPIRQRVGSEEKVRIGIAYHYTPGARFATCVTDVENMFSPAVMQSVHGLLWIVTNTTSTTHQSTGSHWEPYMFPEDYECLRKVPPEEPLLLNIAPQIPSDGFEAEPSVEEQLSAIRQEQRLLAIVHEEEQAAASIHLYNMHNVTSPSALSRRGETTSGMDHERQVAQKEEEEFPGFPKLTEADHQRINQIWSRSLPNQMVLVQGFDTELTQKDLATLSHEEWLNDQVMDYYDSMLGAGEDILQCLKDYLDQEAIAKGKAQSQFWLLNCRNDIPRQQNFSDCGMFSFLYAEYASRRARINFTQEHIPYFRKRMCLEILEKKERVSGELAPANPTPWVVRRTTPWVVVNTFACILTIRKRKHFSCRQTLDPNGVCQKAHNTSLIFVKMC